MSKYKILMERFTTLFKLFDFSTTFFHDRKISQFVGGKEARTYAEFQDKVIEISTLLCRHGIMNGKIAILSENKPNWTVAFFASAAMGRVAVPILPASSQMEISNIISHSGSKALFVSEKQLPKIGNDISEKLDLIINMDTFSIIQAKHGQEITKAMQASNAGTSYASHGSQESACKSMASGFAPSLPEPDDLATIIYTSGTSGSPKGVMLSHRNLCQSILQSYAAQKAGSKDRWLSILPMAHAYEMSLGMLYPMSVGACVYYLEGSPSPSILLEAMKKTRPTIILTVPLIIEKIHKTLIRTIENGLNRIQLPGTKRSIADSNSDSGAKGTRSGKERFSKLFDSSIFCMIAGYYLKKKMGGKLKFFGIGGAKLNPDVEKFLKKTRFPYAIGYGLTEAAPLLCNACVGKTKVGSIGVPAYGVEIRLENINPVTGEGEIIAKGDNVMLGYYKDPERTAEVIDRNGWLHTSDLAVMDSKGRYSIKGRLNNVILGASGENIYPEEIEFVINNFPGVEESLVVKQGHELVGIVKMEDGLIPHLKMLKQSILEYVNKRINKQSSLSRIELITEPFKKTATNKIKRFIYMAACTQA